MKYSLLCPTRDRTKGVERFLKSIQETATDLTQIEILFAVDIDDTPTIQFFGVMNHQHLYDNLNIQFFVRQRSQFTNRDYYNWLAEKATGKYLWAIADDLVFLIMGWDSILESKLEGYLCGKPDRIMCAGIRDNTPKPKASLPNFPCFPLVTAEAFKFFGFLLHPQIPTWGADYLLYLLYTGAKRYLEVQDFVYLNHISWHTKQTSEDATAKNIRDIFRRFQCEDEHNVDKNASRVIPIQIDQLKTYLRNLETPNA